MDYPGLLQRAFLAVAQIDCRRHRLRDLRHAFIRIDDFARAQKIADEFRPDDLHRILDRYAETCCPIMDMFLQKYHWSFMQIEYSTDLVFRNESKLQPLYKEISREAVLAVKAENVSSFPGKKVTPQLAQEIGWRFLTA